MKEGIIVSNSICLVKGINLGGWLSQCEYTNEHYDTFIKEEDIKTVSQLGVDHIRVPFDYELLETESGEPIPGNYRYLDNCIEWARKYGLNVILDMHKTAGYSFNDAYKESNNLFNFEPLQSRYINLWTEVAKRYGKHSDMVVFELLNEIVEEVFAEPWNKLSYRTITEIRKHAPDTKIIIGGINWNSLNGLVLLDKPYDSNIIYTFHCYEPLVFTHQKAYWVPQIADVDYIQYPLSKEELSKQSTRLIEAQRKTLDALYFNNDNDSLFDTLFADAVQFAKDRNVPLYCGEYGVIDMAPTDSTLNWFKEINKAFKKFGIGRSVWSYKKMDFGLIDEHYAPIKDELIKLL